MLKRHMAAVESSLLEISRIPANSGHSLHKGTPREAFIKKFLSEHLSERVAIGTGEIIDYRSKPNEPRNQIDIVIFKRDHPRLDLGGTIQCFFVESVVATIEVKSKLKKSDVRQAMKAALSVKSLEPSAIEGISYGFDPPGMLSFVVAYDGPAKMSTVMNWLAEIAAELECDYPTMPPSAKERQKFASPAIDGVYVLGRGLVQFDNFPLGFVTDEIREMHPATKWAVIHLKTGSLLLLFALLTVSATGFGGPWLNPIPYLSGLTASRLGIHD